MAQFATREAEIAVAAAAEQATTTKDKALGRKRGRYQASESASETGPP